MLKLPDSARSLVGLSQFLIETLSGRIPLSKVASIEDGDGPNQISRDDGKRRIVLSANASGRALSEIVTDIRRVTAETRLPEGMFITLAGISVRNGILKVSHYINLMRFEGENFDHPMIVRGSLERLSPVLMTALVTAVALAPLLFGADRPCTQVLHPVAVVTFSGLISSTLLDTFLTPAMFWLFGRKDAERLMDDQDAEAL